MRSFITEISRKIKTNETSKETDDSEFDLYFPELIFAIRDFYLDLEIDGKPVTSDEYLEHCLAVSKEEDESSKRRNLSRICLRKYFKRRHCFVFDTPGDKKL